MTEIELKDAERQPCEIWTRVMGYHRPVSQFNKGKQSEFAERKYFSIEKMFSAAKKASPVTQGGQDDRLTPTKKG